MKKLLKIALYFVLSIVLLIGFALIYVKTALPDVGEAEVITINNPAERIARGKYLANTITVCMDCHSVRNWSKFSGPLTDGTLGKGGDRFDQAMGLPGVFYAKNITPAGIQRYTDGELFRVITTGVTKEGRAMFPLMPYPYYGRMDREDIYDIIAYIRSISPIESTIPESIPDFPMNFIINTIPQKASFQTRPDTTDQLAYGGYLVNASGCIECHTQVVKGQIITDLGFSGGREFKFPNGSIVRSSNITSDPETGIGNWTKEEFIVRFKAYADSSYSVQSVLPGEFNTIMPWTMYAQMKESDLSAIYTYLHTVRPIPNKVEKFTAATALSTASN